MAGDEGKPTPQAATTAAQSSTSVEGARHAGIDPATGQSLTEDDVRKAQDNEHQQQDATAPEGENDQQTATSEDAEAATAESTPNPLEGADDTQPADDTQAAGATQTEGDTQAVQPEGDGQPAADDTQAAGATQPEGGDASPWESARTHDEINQYLGDRPAPEDWDDMTIKQKKEWLDANA